jgi:hypothetical protein
MGNDLWFVAGDERAVQGKLALHAAQVGYPALQPIFPPNPKLQKPVKKLNLLNKPF